MTRVHGNMGWQPRFPSRSTVHRNAFPFRLAESSIRGAQLRDPRCLIRSCELGDLRRLGIDYETEAELAIPAIRHQPLLQFLTSVGCPLPIISIINYIILHPQRLRSQSSKNAYPSLLGSECGATPVHMWPNTISIRMGFVDRLVYLMFWLCWGNQIHPKTNFPS